jgi:hypothetical protein
MGDYLGFMPKTLQFQRFCEMDALLENLDHTTVPTIARYHGDFESEEPHVSANPCPKLVDHKFSSIRHNIKTKRLPSCMINSLNRKPDNDA